MSGLDAERVSPMADDDSVSSEPRRPTRVPSIKIEPPCELGDFDDRATSVTALTVTTTSIAGSSSNNVLANYNALSPSMSPNQRAMVDLRNQPGNYKKNLTARFLQQGHSEDDGYYRSETEMDMRQPDEKRSKSLDRGLEYDPSEVQPLDLTTSLYKPSGDELRNKFEARARKMHRRSRAESEENLTHLLQVNTSEHLVAMQRLSHSDMQLDRLQQAQPSRQSTPSSSLAESDNAPSNTESLDRPSSAVSTTPMTSNKNLMPLPPINMVYSRGASSSSTDGSLDMDRGSPFSTFATSNMNVGSLNPVISNLYGGLTEGGPIPPPPNMPLNNINGMAAFLEWQSRVNQTVNQCFICKQTFPGFDNMAKHVAKHLPTEVKTDNNNRVHVCKVCNRSFSRSDMLTRHMRLHTGLKPYECKECGQVFSRSDHLNTHKRTHTGEKPYQCPKCPYAACRRDMITRHMRIHTNKATDKKRRKLGMLYPKDSVSGSSIESTDSTPSRGGSLSGNSFDSSFESTDLRWPPRHLLDPGDLLRSQTGRANWSASNSFDSSDYSRGKGGGAWSSLTSADSIESDSLPHGTSFDGDYMSSPPKTSCSPSPAVFNMPTMQLVSPERSAAALSAKHRRPSLVRQDASLDQDASKVTAKNSNLPFTDYKTKLEYRNSTEGKLMDCTDDIDVGGADIDSVGTADSPRPTESPIPMQDDSNGRRLNAAYLPKQASLSDELNLQKCALNE